MMDESINDIGQVFSVMKGPVAVYSIIGIILLIILAFICKKTSKKNKELSRKEVAFYIDNAFKWAEAKRTPSGNIYFSGNSITYSRGNRTAEFPIYYLGKETLIAPFMIDEWFAERNYSKREADTILEDIKYYLEENGYSKTVSIVTDEEYFSVYPGCEDDNEKI